MPRKYFQAAACVIEMLVGCVEQGPSAEPPLSLPVSFQPGQLESLAAWIQSAAVSQGAASATQDAHPAATNAIAAAAATGSLPKPGASRQDRTSGTAPGKIKAPDTLSKTQEALVPGHVPQAPLAEAGPHLQLSQDPTAEHRLPAADVNGNGAEPSMQPDIVASGKPIATSWNVNLAIPTSQAWTSADEDHVARVQVDGMQNQAHKPPLPELKRPSASPSPPQAGEKAAPARHQPAAALAAANQDSPANDQTALKAGWQAPPPAAQQPASAYAAHSMPIAGTPWGLHGEPQHAPQQALQPPAASWAGHWQQPDAYPHSHPHPPQLHHSWQQQQYPSDPAISSAWHDQRQGMGHAAPPMWHQPQQHNAVPAGGWPQQGASSTMDWSHPNVPAAGSWSHGQQPQAAHPGQAGHPGAWQLQHPGLPHSWS